MMPAYVILIMRTVQSWSAGEEAYMTLCVCASPRTSFSLIICAIPLHCCPLTADTVSPVTDNRVLRAPHTELVKQTSGASSVNTVAAAMCERQESHNIDITRIRCMSCQRCTGLKLIVYNVDFCTFISMHNDLQRLWQWWPLQVCWTVYRWNTVPIFFEMKNMSPSVAHWSGLVVYSKAQMNKLIQVLYLQILHLVETIHCCFCFF